MTLLQTTTLGSAGHPSEEFDPAGSGAPAIKNTEPPIGGSAVPRVQPVNSTVSRTPAQLTEPPAVGNVIQGNQLAGSKRKTHAKQQHTSSTLVEQPASSKHATHANQQHGSDAVGNHPLGREHPMQAKQQHRSNALGMQPASSEHATQDGGQPDARKRKRARKMANIEDREEGKEVPGSKPMTQGDMLAGNKVPAASKCLHDGKRRRKGKGQIRGVRQLQQLWKAPPGDHLDRVSTLDQVIGALWSQSCCRYGAAEGSIAAHHLDSGRHVADAFIISMHGMCLNPFCQCGICSLLDQAIIAGGQLGPLDAAIIARHDAFMAQAVRGVPPTMSFSFIYGRSTQNLGDVCDALFATLCLKYRADNLQLLQSYMGITGHRRGRGGCHR